MFGTEHMIALRIFEVWINPHIMLVRSMAIRSSCSTAPPPKHPSTCPVGRFALGFALRSATCPRPPQRIMMPPMAMMIVLGSTIAFGSGRCE